MPKYFSPRQFVQHNFLPICLVILVVVICAANYVPGTYLTGWDTLHPEFNFSLNFLRVLFGVWRQEQGLGAVAIHSHMVEIPRIMLLWISSFVLPESFLRYLYLFLTLVFGPLGVYKFILYATTEYEAEEPTNKARMAAFLGGTFFLLNLGTVQHFFVPFEMFLAHYATVGWVFYFATKLLKKVTRADLLWFIAVLFFASSMAYAATLFYAFFLCLAVYLFLVWFRRHHHSHQVPLRRVVGLLATVLVVNGYWLLPNMYAVLFHSAEVQNAKINSFFTLEAFLHNQAFGDLPDIAVLKGFLFNWAVYRGNGEFEYLLNAWRSYTSLPWVIVLEYVVVVVIVTGVVVTVRKRKPLGLAIAGTGLLAILFLMNANPPFGWFVDIIREHSSLLREALRTPYTKFSIVLMLCYAYFFAIGSSMLFDFVSQARAKISAPIITGLLTLVLVVTMFPLFTGHLISPYMELQFPSEYKALYSWFDTQPHDARIAQLPMPTFWAWNYYDWGYQGAGFIWFGLHQPIMDRDFDRWSTYNEQYYREVSYAVYAQDVDLFTKLLQKYRIRYILFDEHMTVADIGNLERQLYIKETKNMLTVSKAVKLQKRFGTKLSVYEVILPPVNALTSTPVTEVSPAMQYSSVDYAYQTVGQYFTKPAAKKPEGIIYLFRTLLGQNDQIDPNVIQVAQNAYSLKFKVPNVRGELNLPNYASYESFVPVDLYAQRTADAVHLRVVYGIPWPEQISNRPSSDLVIPVGLGDSTLAVNQARPMRLPDVGNQYTLLGRVTLLTHKNNEFTIYPNVSSAPVALNIARQSIVPESCGRVSGAQLFGVDDEQNSIGMYSQNVVACVTLAMDSVLNQAGVGAGNDPILMRLDFDFSGSNSAIPYYCLFDTVTEKCFYTSYGDITSATVSAGHFTDVVAINPLLLHRFKLRFFLDSVNAPEVKTLRYKNIAFSFTNPATASVLTDHDIQTVFATNSFGLLKNSTLSVTGLFQELNRADNPDITRIRRNPRTCSDIAPIAYDRNVMKQGEERYVEYMSLNGTSCDYLDYQALPHDQAYLVAITAKYVEGLPLRVCISNIYTKRCDIYSQLGTDKQFKTYYIYLPPNTSPGFGFDINFNNVSIGKVRTVNQVQAVRVFPFPGSWLGHLSIGTDQQQAPSPVLVNAGPLPFITTKLVGPSPTRRLLMANSAYEPGWVLFRMYGIVPVPVFGSHVLVNNWANGWVVGQSSGNARYVLFFMPQLLQVFGTVLLLSFLAMLARKQWYSY